MISPFVIATLSDITSEELCIAMALVISVFELPVIVTVWPPKSKSQAMYKPEAISEPFMLMV